MTQAQTQLQAESIADLLAREGEERTVCVFAPVGYGPPPGLVAAVDFVRGKEPRASPDAGADGFVILSGPGIRRDSGMYEGWTVPIDYDPLLAKLIGYGTDRKQTMGRLIRALNEYFVGGIKTNISLFRRILNDPDFQAGKLDTGYLDRLLVLSSGAIPAASKGSEIAAIAAGLFAVLEPIVPSSNGASPSGAGNGRSSWKRAARAEGLRSG